MACLDEPLFAENLYAWQHGPVVRSLYHEFKHYGSEAIWNSSVEFNLENGSTTEPRIPKDDEQVGLVLDRVWEIYKYFKAWDLRNKTYEEGTPWRQVYLEGRNDIVIPDDLICAHFTEKIRQYLLDG